MDNDSNWDAPTVVPTDPDKLRASKQSLRTAKSRLSAIRRAREARRAKAQKRADCETAKIAILDAKLRGLDKIARVIEEGWDAWTPDPKVQPYRATPLPLRALSRGALKVMRAVAEPMTTKEIAVRVFREHGLQPPSRAKLACIAAQITANLSRVERLGYVQRERKKGGHIWSIVPQTPRGAESEEN